jgi:uncharacterized protein (TIGR02246 family)
MKQATTNAEETAIRSLYRALINSWNNMDANGYASLFTDDANLIGFDGSQANGKKSIQQHLTDVFAQHKVATYVIIIREIRFLTPDVVVLRSMAGMIPPGKTDINPDTNAIQTLIAQKENDVFKIALFQNTPAAWHWHPEQKEALTKELTAAIGKEW